MYLCISYKKFLKNPKPKKFQYEMFVIKWQNRQLKHIKRVNSNCHNPDLLTKHISRTFFFFSFIFLYWNFLCCKRQHCMILYNTKHIQSTNLEKKKEKAEKKVKSFYFPCCRGLLLTMSYRSNSFYYICG